MRQLSQTLVRLNLETHANHAAADRVWLRLCDDDGRVSEQDYLRSLVQTYGFEAPLEAALAYTPHFDSLVDMHGRYRSGLIAQDLLTLGLGASNVAGVPQQMIAPFCGIAEALGWLYVHERATLCHEQARAAVLGHLPHLARATSYLSAEPGMTGVRFDQLGEILERFARTRILEDRIVSAAREAFRTLDAWSGLDGRVRAAR